METPVLVALLGVLGTVAGSFFGVVTASRLTTYRLQQLEDKVARHNNLIERTYILEGQMAECQHDLRDLKAAAERR